MSEVSLASALAAAAVAALAGSLAARVVPADRRAAQAHARTAGGAGVLFNREGIGLVA